MIKLIFVMVICCMVSGCVGDNCWRRNGLGVDSQECKEYRASNARPKDPGVAWYEYIFLPVFASVPVAELHSTIANSPHNTVQLWPQDRQHIEGSP